MVFTRRQSRMMAITPKANRTQALEATSPKKEDENAPASIVKLFGPAAIGKQSAAASTATVMSPENASLGFFSLSSITQRTPKSKASIEPAGEEMHPHHHQKTTITPYDEARWLGFFNMTGAKTEPPKKSDSQVMADPTTPTPVMTTNMIKNPFTSPTFSFTLDHHSLGLSEEAQKVMEETRAEATKIRKQMAELPLIPDGEPGVKSSISDRKIATPRRKVGRYSDVHMTEFKKMDSIANHPSAWRSNPNRFKPSTTPSLKRTSSKADLDDTSGNSTSRKALFTKPLFRAQEEEEAPVTPSAKRVRLGTSDRPATVPPKFQQGKPMTITGSTLKSTASIPSNLFTPTKATLARNQSGRGHSSSRIPEIARSKSSRDLTLPRTPQLHRTTSLPRLKAPSPLKVANFVNDAPIKVAADGDLYPTLPSKPVLQIRSILRTPHRRYTKDPIKIAAGTHFATPPDLNKDLTVVPATTPVVKHVDFSASALLKAEHDEQKVASVEPEEVLYPTSPTVEVSEEDRRSTISSLHIPGAFTFRSGTPMTFAPSAAGTIRQVRVSDASPDPIATSPTPRKRKLDAVEEEEASDDKENIEEGRPAKKFRAEEKSAIPAPVRKTPLKKTAGKSRLPMFASRRGNENRSTGLTAARLNFLSMPKKRT